MSREHSRTIPDWVARSASPRQPEPRPALGPSCALGLLLWAFLLVVGLVCLLRRLSGGFLVSLSNPHMLELWLACALALVLAVTLCEEPLRRFCRGQRHLTALLGSLPLALWVLAFCPFRSLLGPSLGLVLFVGLVEVLLRPRNLGQFWSRLNRISLFDLKAEESISQSIPPESSPKCHAPADSAGQPVQSSFPPGTTQSIVRRLVGSDEVLEGELLAEFLPTERLRILHVSFTPSFASIPETDVSCEDSAIRATVAAKYCHGMRIEVRRLGANAAEQTRIHFSVRAPRRNN